MIEVVGLDLSLTSTGVATSSWTRAIKPRKLTSYPRLRYIRSTILDILCEVQPHLLVVEGPSYGSVGPGQHERGGLWWMVTDLVDEAGILLAVAPPANIKKYATGFGGGPNADKDKVLLQAAKRFDWFVGGNDEADALWACAMGHDWLKQPIIEMPQLNRAGLDKVAWPAVAEGCEQLTTACSDIDPKV